MRSHYKTSQVWLMWGLASLFYAYQYVLRVLPNIMMTDIMSSLHIDALLFGQFAGLYYVGYVAAHIPLGLLLDRWGPRVVLPTSCLLTAIGLLPLIYADTWIYPAIGRTLTGMGSTGAILGVFKVIRMTFPEARFTRMLGISVTIGLVGAIYGGAPVNYLLMHFGWRTVLKGICWSGVFLSLLMVIFMAPYHRSDAVKGNIWRQIKVVFTNKMLWSICLLGGLMVGPLEGFADVWGSQYLMTAYHLSSEEAAALPSLIFFGMFFGAPLLSYAADRWKSYYGVIILSGWVMGISFVLLFFAHLSPWVLSVLFSVVGFFCAYQIPTIYKATSYVPKENMGLATAGANMIIMFFGYIFHGLMGGLMDVFWQGHMENGVRIYQAATFVKGLSVIPMGLILGSIGLMIVRAKAKK